MSCTRAASFNWTPSEFEDMPQSIAAIHLPKLDQTHTYTHCLPTVLLANAMSFPVPWINSGSNRVNWCKVF
eukprot:2482191-Amphidinium_carterae.1